MSKSDLTNLVKKITTNFKLSGFQIRSENSIFIAEQLQPLDEDEREKWLSIIIDNVQSQRLETVSVERPVLEKAINEINRVGLEEGETVFNLISAFNVPQFYYNNQSKKFELEKGERNILANCAMKSRYLRERYFMLLQKTLRHELFAPSIIVDGVSVRGKTFKLLYAENLLASSTVDEAVIMGLLTQLKEGVFSIEDPTGAVELDLSETRYHSGFFCEGSFVLAEGSYDNGILKVDGLGFPPAEPASSSRAYFGTLNSWGGESQKLLKYSHRLQEIERTNTEATLVFLADVCLDKAEVMDNLRMLFVGYDSCPPVAIVLMGPFVSTIGHYHELQQHFTALGALAAGCDQLKKQTDLILVPSCEDPTAPSIFPRAALPQILTAGLRKAWPRTLLATNPCRIQYCTQQITVCRLDLMAKFCRNTLHFPDIEEQPIENHLARTLVCQNHITPLQPLVMPTHWAHDAVLWLYPLPDLVVLGDTCPSFSTAQHGCSIVNTGSFVKSKFSFKVYYPATRTIEDSEIPQDIAAE